MADDAQTLPRPQTAHPADTPEQRLGLLQRLQNSQEPATLIRYFYEAVASPLALSGLSYHPPDNGAERVLGKPGRHQCDYCLSGPGQALGQLIVSRNRRFSESDHHRLEHWLALLVGPLSNAQRYQRALQLAMQDSLTGLGNRAALDSTLHRELRLAERHDSDLSLLLLDVDHFKQLNDRFGHSRGDRVLKQVASAIADSSRESDLVYRYGGEEFVVLLSKTDLDGASVIAERLRRAVSRALQEREQLSVTVSIGIASRQPGSEPDIFSLFDRADRALYYAKRAGRDRVAPALKSVN